VGVVIALLVAVGTTWLSRRAALTEAVDDARNTTTLLAESVVAPALPGGVLRGRPAAVDRFDRNIRHRVLVGEVQRVKVWAADGTILYSDRPELIGRQFDLGQEEQEVLAEGGVDAEVSDLGKPENVYERPLGKLLEVYTPIETASGERVLFEAYFPYSDVVARTQSVQTAFRPFTVGGILLLLLLTVPLVWLLARRLDDSASARERLLMTAARASDSERRRIARDLHDGVVQELAGSAFTVSAAAREVAGDPLSEEQRRRVGAELTTASGGLRHSLRMLRSLLVEIYPPDLKANGLHGALDDLVAAARAEGVQVDLHVGDVEDLTEEDIALLWRAAQECVRNALRHGQPSTLAIEVVRLPAAVRLTVTDDGRGFDESAVVDPDHFGLRGLRDLAAEAGGEFTVHSSPGAGTRATLEVTSR
jgi:two-component system, NarL family, sensor kinase